MQNFKSNTQQAFTMVEVMVVAAIIAVLGGIFVVTMTGLRGGDAIDRGAQMIYNDLIYIRSRAISTNSNHRLSFTSTSRWSVQSYNGSTWSNVKTNQTLPTNTYLTSTSFSNAASNLEANARGLFVFNNSSSGTPYVVVSGSGTTKTKSINVFVGGAMELRTP